MIPALKTNIYLKEKKFHFTVNFQSDVNTLKALSNHVAIHQHSLNCSFLKELPFLLGIL